MKTGNITEAVRLLIFAASVIITCILVFLGFRTADTAKEISNNAVGKMSELNKDIKDSDYTRYNDIEVKGSEVINFIKQHLGDYSDEQTAPIYVYVKTSVSENTYNNDSHLKDVKNFTNVRYIKPTAVFQGKVVENENKVIVGVSFYQK